MSLYVPYYGPYNKHNTNIHALGGIRTHNPSKRAAADLRLRPRGHWDRLWDWTRASAVGDRRLTAWAMARLLNVRYYLFAVLSLGYTFLSLFSQLHLALHKSVSSFLDSALLLLFSHMWLPHPLCVTCRPWARLSTFAFLCVSTTCNDDKK